MLRFEAASGLLNCDHLNLRDAVIEVAGPGLCVRSTDAPWTAGANGIPRMNAGSLELEVNVSSDAVAIAAKNTSARPVRIDDIRITFPPALVAEQWLEYIHSFNMASRCAVKTVGQPTAWHDPNAAGHVVYVLRRIGADDAVLFGALPPHAGDYVHFRAVHDQPHMEGRFGLEIRSEQRRTLTPGQRAAMSTICAAAGTDPWKLLCDYGDRFGKALNRAPHRAQRQVGWNSWDFYLGAVEEDDVFTHAQAAGELIEAPRIVIDEGWERRWGVWDVNWKFPAGLKGLVDGIRARGGRPGIWTAPLLVNRFTRFFQQNTDWFVRDADGQITEHLFAYGPMSFLDPTIPAVREWIANVFGNLRQAGFDYFKVDFTQEVLRGQRFADDTIGRGEILRLAFATIRDAIGPESYLLACGAPYESVTGIVDAVRTTADIHARYTHVRTNGVDMLYRSWMQPRLWNTDPDFLVIRCHEHCLEGKYTLPHRQVPRTNDDEWLSGRNFTEDETKTYALLILATGGEVMLSDNLCELNDKAKGLLRTVLAGLLDAPAQPVDFMTRHDTLPRLLIGKKGSRRLLIALNLGDTSDTITVSPAQLGLAGDATDFWTGRTLRASDGQLLLQLPRRTAVGLWFERKR
ncbi:MAG: alpha-galactosidase [Rhodopirellula sp.]|nr:alpha-galactosidase [Rhodopirellula sp.]